MPPFALLSDEPVRPHRVVVVGGGFGGLNATYGLRREPVEVTLVDRRNYHLFQPLTYQVATGALAPGEIAQPLRAIFKRHRNVRVVLAEVTSFDLDRRELALSPVGDVPAPASLSYDTLIIGGGSQYSYFGHDEWREHASEVKSLESALAVRSRLLRAFEAAEAEPDPAARAAWLTFVVVGAGPTGVEMAGQIAELARDTLRRDFRAIDPRMARILLVEASDRVLGTFPPSLSKKAERSLERLGVTVLTGRAVTDVDVQGVTLDGSERVASRTVVWAAGVTASRLAGRLAALTGAGQDRAGRVLVEPDLSLPGHPEVFAIGDMVRVRSTEGEPTALPGVAQVAIQQGRYVARAVRARRLRREVQPFRYRDKGNLATIGRAAAVADLHWIRLSGLVAWLTWLVVHLFYLVGFQNRVIVLIRWTISFTTRGRGARLITEAGEAGGPGSSRARVPPTARRIDGISRTEVLMSSTELTDHATGTAQRPAGVPMRLEVVVLPVADVDRAKTFYEGLGWRLDADIAEDEHYRVVQLTPPASEASVIFGKGVTSAAPGSTDRIVLAVEDIEEAREDLISRGVDVGEAFHEAAGGLDGGFHAAEDERATGRDPEGRSYATYAAFSDPDGNQWLLQELVERLPGRVSSDGIEDLADLLRETGGRHGAFEVAAEPHDWADWYAAYMVARRSGRARDDSSASADQYMLEVKGIGLVGG